nr:reverse transcriptase domain-containing protein [Tanacetum cinerariifolium]
MSDSKDSTVTYTKVSSPFEDLLDIGSLGVVVYGYDGLPMHPPSPDYVLSPKHPPSPVYVPYVLELAYPKFMPPEDDVLPAEEQPLPVAVLPTAESPGYITKSDLEEDLEDDDVDLEVDPANYPTDRDDDDDDEESSGDDADDEEEDEDEEEEEHLTPADFVPPPAYRNTAMMFIRAQTSIPLSSETEVSRQLAIPTLPPSPLTSYSSPLPQMPSPPLPASPTHPLEYRAAMIWLRAESPSTSHPLPLPLPPPILLPHTRASTAMMRVAAPSTYILAPRSETPPLGIPPLLPIPLPTSSPPLLLPSIDRRADVPEVTLPPRKRLCIAIGPRFEVGQCSSAPTARPTGGFRANYGFVSTLDAEIRRDPDRDIELSQRMIDFVTTIRQDTYEIYRRLDDAHDDRFLMTGQVNSLRRDRRFHARTARLMESEARVSPKAWVQSMDASDTAHSEKMALKRTTRSSPATTTTTTTPVTDIQLKALIDQGVANALVAHFMKCKPLYFKDTKGVVELTQWFEIMETVFRISNCTMENQIKFATCNLLGSALTWWNSYVKTVGYDVAYAMTWTNLKKKMTDKYCPRGEIKKLEVRMWNLKCWVYRLY